MRLSWSPIEITAWAIATGSSTFATSVIAGGEHERSGDMTVNEPMSCWRGTAALGDPRRSLGHHLPRCRTGRGGGRALRLLRAGRYAAGLADSRMPSLDGCALCQALRPSSPQVLGRLIVVTGTRPIPRPWPSLGGQTSLQASGLTMGS
jgi:hypothetical protein